MGHLFRQLNFSSFLAKKSEEFIFFVNNDEAATGLFRKSGIPFEIVALDDDKSGWQMDLISKHHVDVWLDDRLDTSESHAVAVKSSGVRRVVFDDRGPGSSLADLNFAGLSFEPDTRLKGGKVYAGLDYLILNPEIDKYKRTRHSANKILVTLGGSDTYGATVKAVELLRVAGLTATVITGPAFKHFRALADVARDEFEIKPPVDSLIAEFRNYDLAVTGGGITPFEANASGLPCVIIANELFEVANAKYLEQKGCSVFAGYHESLDPHVFKRLLDIPAMSRAGLSAISTKGSENIYETIINV
ncbi:MAG: hypothetical protein PHV33_11780 [Elusimicrobiales bacterium]|nr:hypothetical protein [Elusimicrobiales bacterium]